MKLVYTVEIDEDIAEIEGLHLKLDEVIIYDENGLSLTKSKLETDLEVTEHDWTERDYMI